VALEAQQSTIKLLYVPLEAQQSIIKLSFVPLEVLLIVERQAARTTT
jgi:hypothetical protein